ncbi:MAG: PilZ domain-containing protein [Candidatus Dormibacterales bacterium]
MGDRADRRRFPRVQAPVLYRVLGPRIFGTPASPGDVGLGGMRVYSDERHKPWKRLEIEVFLPDQTTITCGAKVVWIEPLARSAGAKFDVGLEFTDISSDDRRRLAWVLDSPAPR